MKSLILVSLFFAANSFGATSINKYLCQGQKLNQLGQAKGSGESLFVLLDNGTVQIVDRSDSSAYQIFHEGPDKSGTSAIFRTVSTKKGVALSIHHSNINTALNRQVNLYLMSLRNDRVEQTFTLNCRVSSASKL